MRQNIMYLKETNTARDFLIHLLQDTEQTLPNAFIFSVTAQEQVHE